MFYNSLPTKLFWPVLLLACMATIIASQALITGNLHAFCCTFNCLLVCCSGAFSLIQQAVNLGFFPRVAIVHTSTKVIGQIYIPSINYALMVCSFVVAVCCVVVVFHSRDCRPLRCWS